MKCDQFIHLIPDKGTKANERFFTQFLQNSLSSFAFVLNVCLLFPPVSRLIDSYGDKADAIRLHSGDFL